MTAPIVPLSFRAPRGGPEQLLLDWFLSENRVPVRAGYRVSAFREPAIESGAPDLVLVVWKPSVTQHWNSARASLTKSDLKLLQILVHQGPQTTAEIESIGRFPLEEGLGRLERAQVIRKRGRRWHLRPLGDIFAATQILAIEAKISNWRRGLEQAATNRWFASTSYLLMPRAPKNDVFWSQAAAAGVGVWTKEKCFRGSAAPNGLPCSYASWVFHECAWRQSLT